MDSDDILQKYLEAELEASARGYPGAQEDLITYIQIDMLRDNPSCKYDLLKKFETGSFPISTGRYC